MKNIIDRFLDLSRFLILAIWAYAIMGLIGSGAYKAFLKPVFGIVLGVGLFVIALFLYSEMISRGSGRYSDKEIEARRSLPALARGMIILLPVFFLWQAGGSTLDVYAFRKRSTESAIKIDESIVTGKYDDYAFSGDDKTIIEDDGVFHVDILTLCSSPNFYEGKTVSVIGMIDDDEELKAVYGDKYSLLFRFVITCCVADAVPVAVLIETGLNQNISLNEWYRVEGTFVTGETEEGVLPIILDAMIEPAEPPNNPYL